MLEKYMPDDATDGGLEAIRGRIDNNLLSADDTSV
jgi:hypothetical protein